MKIGNSSDVNLKSLGEIQLKGLKSWPKNLLMSERDDTSVLMTSALFRHCKYE